MARQARAEATRRRIIDSAVELFAELGYGETGLADVLQRANVSKGAFYYHFDSKEAVAAAIIDEYNRKLLTAAGECFDANAPHIDGILRASFRCAEIIENDPVARVGNDLLQGLSQISSVAARIYREWTNSYIDVLTKAVADWELRGDLKPAEVAHAIWSGILATHLLASAGVEDRYSRLARGWRFILSAVAPDDVRTKLDATLTDVVGGHRVAV